MPVLQCLIFLHFRSHPVDLMTNHCKHTMHKLENIECSTEAEQPLRKNLCAPLLTCARCDCDGYVASKGRALRGRIGRADGGMQQVFRMKNNGNNCGSRNETTNSQDDVKSLSRFKSRSMVILFFSMVILFFPGKLIVTTIDCMMEVTILKLRHFHYCLFYDKFAP